MPTKWLYTLPLRLQSLFRRRTADRELDEELRYHVEQKSEEYVRRGMSEQEARRAALLELGGLEQAKEKCRDARKVAWLQDFIDDVKYGARMLRKAPGFAAIIILTLALGIGANTAIFSVVNAVLLEPLPFPHPDRLVMVFNHFPDLNEGPASYPDFEDWSRQSRAFDGMVAVFRRNLNWTGKGEPERVRTELVSRGFFHFFGIKPALGRLFTPEEHRSGAPAVCALSYDFWQKHFGGQRDILGQTLMLDGKAYAVVGVMPASASADFQYWKKIGAWIPLEPNAPWTQHGTNYLNVTARLKQGVTLDQARAELDAIQRGINAQFPANKHDVRVVPLMQSLLGDTRPLLLILLAAVGFVLLIACVNVANLLLARATARRREFAIRDALGAERWRLVRQALTESILLGAFGGAAGVLLAIFGVHLLVHTWPSGLPRLAETRVDAPVLAFSAVLSLTASFLFGLFPALQTSRTGAIESLKEGSRHSTEGPERRRARGLLVMLETALACVLLVGAGLTLKSLARLERVDPGFNPENLLALDISLPAYKYSQDSTIAAFYRRLLARVRALPGVRSAGTVTHLPFEGSTTGDFKVEGRPPFPQGQAPIAEERIVSPGYFETMQTPLIEGRFFDEGDGRGAGKVVIISESLARMLWPHRDPLGQHIDAGWGKKLPNGQPDWQRVVGVVHDTRFESLDHPSPYTIYLCAWQYPASMALVVRTAAEPLALASEVRKQVFAVDPEQPVYGVDSMDQVVAETLSGRRASTYLLAIFAALATLLTCVGIYGVISYSVSQQTHEFGIRMALGAEPGQMLGMVLGQGAKLASAGVVLGLAGAVGLTRLMSSLLFGVAATDPMTYAAVALLLAVVALGASLLPARRALRVDPVVALRDE